MGDLDRSSDGPARGEQTGEPIALERVAGGVVLLAPRRPRPRHSLLRLAAAALLCSGAVFLALHQSGWLGSGVTGGTEPPPLPPDPAAFAGDPRFERCLGASGQVLYAFEMAHARDFWRHFPAALKAPELEVDDPAFVAVYRNLYPGAFSGGAPAAGQTRAPRTPTPGLHDVCVLVGADPTTAVPNIYGDVSLDAFTPRQSETASADESTARQTPAPSRQPMPAPTPSVEPAPPWTADLAGQLQCEGLRAGLGGETGEVAVLDGAPDPASGVDSLLATGGYAALPKRGFAPRERDDHWTRFVYEVADRVKSVLILTDAPPGIPSGSWYVVGLRACDPSEFDPADGLTFDIAIWRDRADRPVSTTVVHSIVGPGHCGWESTTWLYLSGGTYISDPQGVLEEFTDGSFAPKVKLPADAVPTGYHSGSFELFVAPDGRSVYAVALDHVERWPRADPVLGCA